MIHDPRRACGVPRSALAATLAGVLLLVAATAHSADHAPADSASTAAPAFPPPRVRAWQTGVTRADRLQHASLSFTLAAGATLAGRRPLAAFAATLALGLAKELHDARVTGFDPADLAMDAAGAALGASAAGRRR